MNDRMVFSIDGTFVSEAEIGASPLSASAMFGFGAMDRLRGFRGADGKMRIVGFTQHLDRTLATARALFGELPDLRGAWQEWITVAVRRSELNAPYIHIGYGQVRSAGTMLQSSAAPVQTFIFVAEAAPLYGDALYVSSELNHPRPDGPLHAMKTHGAYAALLFLKNRARQRYAEKRADVPPQSVEALLFSRDTIQAVGMGLLHDGSVAEFGCSNAGALDEKGNLWLPHGSIPCFRGITIRIVEELFKAAYPGREVKDGLRRSHLMHDGFAAGTAPKHLVPVVEVDGFHRGEITPRFRELAEIYNALCYGSLKLNGFDNATFAPVVF